jgi:hypothetical protein
MVMWDGGAANQQEACALLQDSEASCMQQLIALILTPLSIAFSDKSACTHTCLYAAWGGWCPVAVQFCFLPAPFSPLVTITILCSSKHLHAPFPTTIDALPGGWVMSDYPCGTGSSMHKCMHSLC